MARRIVKLPDIGEGTTEAEIVAWLVKPGDIIQEEDPLAEIMTDKATVEVPAPAGGTVISINGKVGEKLAVGSELVVLEVAGSAEPILPSASRATVGGEAVPHPNPLAPGGAGEQVETQSPRPIHGEREGPAAARREGEGQRSVPAPPSGLSGKPLASPAVRKQAWDLGIELQFVPGTGPAGRVTHEDLAAYVTSGARAAASGPGFARRDGIDEVAVIGLRRAIAEHLNEAARIPHFSYVEEVDVTAIEELRAHLNETRAERGHLTLLPFLMRAIVNAIVEYPQINARYDDAAGIVHRHRAAHIGVATQTDAGLTVPVVRHAETLDLWQTAAELRRLSEAARAGKAKREELSGSTITVTSLGRLGGLAATPVINHPEVAIVGVNRIDERPVVRGGQVVVRRMMNLSSSFDHRVVDGWEAALFIARVKGYLEQPATLFIA